VFGNSDSGLPPPSQVAGDTAVALTPSLLSPAPAESENLRRYCRNPHCRAKLAAPVSNDRDAFCSRGCHTAFFRTRCQVCEKPIEQPAHGGTRLVCNRASCKSAWRTRFDLGRYPTLKNVKSIQEVPVFKGPKVGVGDDRASAWRVIAAGAPISANQYHCATIGAAEGIAAANRSNRAHWARSGRRS
jgi:hypothetical protein